MNCATCGEITNPWYECHKSNCKWKISQSDVDPNLLQS
jgi:hypothetical protein